MATICAKYRILPKAQQTALCATLDLCRHVYNSLVNERTALYEMTGTAPTLRLQQLSLTRWKAAHPELKDVHSQVLQNVAVRVDLAFQAFFRRVKAGETPGYPRLKGPDWYDSITFPQAPSGCKLMGDTLHLSKIGAVKAIVHRPLVGIAKTCTIRRQGSHAGRDGGKWFACFACEYEPVPLPASEEVIGVDVGLSQFAALSDGSFVANPRFFRRDEKALAKAQRKQSRTASRADARSAKRSRARPSANKVLARIHERIRNRRHDFVHQFARRLVNQYGLIAVEKLNVRGMVKNHCLAKSISDASWSLFRAVLSAKAAQGVCAAVAGRTVASINPAYTSQTCSRCGHVAKKALKERWHHCPMCGLSLDRDTNAAFNILQTAVGQHSVVG